MSARPPRRGFGPGSILAAALLAHDASKDCSTCGLGDGMHAPECPKAGGFRSIGCGSHSATLEGDSAGGSWRVRCSCGFESADLDEASARGLAHFHVVTREGRTVRAARRDRRRWLRWLLRLRHQPCSRLYHRRGDFRYAITLEPITTETP